MKELNVYMPLALSALTIKQETLRQPLEGWDLVSFI